MNEDRIICYCFGVRRDDVVRHFADPAARLENLIAATGITTKCTACALDLDTLLDDIQVGQRLSGLRASPEATERGGIVDRVDRIDSGFLICDGTVATRIRLANFPPLFEGEGFCTPHRYILKVFNNAGALSARTGGRIGTSEEKTIDLDALEGCPSEGWFLLRQVPEGPGYYGTLRPQAVLDGGGWTAAYHTQFHRDASRSGRRAGAPLRAVDGRTRTAISIINGSKRRTGLRLSLDGPAYSKTIEDALPGDGACILEVDERFGELPNDSTLILRVTSDMPTRKNLINRHPDGSLGVDHFPNSV